MSNESNNLQYPNISYGFVENSNSREIANLKKKADVFNKRLQDLTEIVTKVHNNVISNKQSSNRVKFVALLFTAMLCHVGISMKHNNPEFAERGMKIIGTNALWMMFFI
jgi:uncharacterized coiled-coil DUF342 family protein